MNKVYQLDVKKVAQTIEAKVKEYSRMREERGKDAVIAFRKWKKSPQLFSGRPSTPFKVRKMYSEWIKKEQEYYATVRIVRLKAGKYILVYGDVDNDTVTRGTGPFKTIVKAQNWFFNQGR